MDLKRTDDEIIARGDTWGGVVLELRERLADFTVDGERFGSLLPETRSGSFNDRRLTKRSEEVVTAVFILGRLGYEHVQLFSRSDDGTPLERPDLDALFENGDAIGIEVAQVSPTYRMNHDANIAILEHTIRDMIDTDPSFSEAFSSYHLSVSLSSILGDRDISGKKQGRAIINEIAAFIRARGHHQDLIADATFDGWFDREYPVLHSRGATYYCSPSASGPYFSVIEGGTINLHAEIDQVLRVLNSHRRQAATYRTKRTWMMMYLPDSNEAFRNTVTAIAELKPHIAPFDACHITDAAWHLATLR